MLQRLGDSRSNQEIEILNCERGSSQEQMPTDIIKSSQETMIDTSVQSLHIQTLGNIRFPNPQNGHLSSYKGLSVSSITLGRVIEDLDRPSETYYDSEVASFLEADEWAVGSARESPHLWELIPVFHYPKEAGAPWEIRRSLTSEGIKTYRSMLSIKDTAPEFLEPSEKKDLAEWVSQRKAGEAAFIITAYQTYINAVIRDEVIHSPNEQLRSPLLIKIPGFRSRQKAILEEEGKCSHHYEVTINL